MNKCIIIAEEEYEGTYEFDSEKEMQAFVHGVDVGSQLYGSGSCITATLEDIGNYGGKIDDLIREHLGDS